jgi:Tol biopolymer transport system component
MKAISLIFVVTFFSCGQANEKKINIDYLGQKPPLEKAELFARGIISTSSFEHSAPAFSPDGKTVLWTIMEMPTYHAMILELRFENGKWSSPFSPSFSDSTANDIYPSFSHDGKQLYFSSTRRASIHDTVVKANRLWKVERNEKGWGIPILLDTIVSKGGEFASSVTESGSLYFTYGPQRSPDWNILKSEKNNNKYSKPVVQTFNSTGYEDGPFVAPDESYIIFESERPESMNGSIDLYICFKDKDGKWGKPKNMGIKVNSSFSERFARVSPDGNYLFFGSNRNQTEKQPGFDIFWIDTRLIEELRKDTPSL